MTVTHQNAIVQVSAVQTDQKATVAPGRYLSLSRKHVLKDLDINGSTGINSWVESMRASSPTHLKSLPFPSDQPFNQPSALDMFEEIVTASKGKKIVIFLDYDGTLSPIVNDPDKAYMSNAMRNTVRKVAGYFPTAIVTGRCIDKVYSFIRLSELFYAGSHGMDIKSPTKASKHLEATEAVLFQPAVESLPMINEVYNKLLGRMGSIEGANVENNKFCASVHFRCVAEIKWSELAHEVRAVMKDYPKLRVTQGRKVLEIRPCVEWDKGKALEFLLESLGFEDCNDVLPIYIGDDKTDEDAFKVLKDKEQGFGILVSKIPKETYASYYLQEPSEVMDFLQRLAKWKRSILRKQVNG